MAIIKLPDTISANMICAICGTKLTLAQAIAGMQDACNHQAFACATHLYQVQQLIMGWAGFMAAPRRQYRNIKGRS
jgi:hypothetical protein